MPGFTDKDLAALKAFYNMTDRVQSGEGRYTDQLLGLAHDALESSRGFQGTVQQFEAAHDLAKFALCKYYKDDVNRLANCQDTDIASGLADWLIETGREHHRKNGAPVTIGAFNEADLSADVKSFINKYVIKEGAAHKFNINDFAHDLPKFTPRVDAYYSNAAKNDTKLSIDSLGAIYRQGLTMSASSLPARKQNALQINLDYVLQIALQNMQKKEAPEPVVSEDEEVKEFVTNGFFAKDHKTGAWYTKVNDKYVELGKYNTEVDRHYKKESKCYGLGIANAGECAAHLFKCILSKEKDPGTRINTCVLGMQTAAIDDKELVHTHPSLVLESLRKLGFQKISAWDSKEGRKIDIIQSAGAWKRRVERDFVGKVDMTKLLPGLVTYLDKLVSYVNGNPTIINPDYPFNMDDRGPAVISDFAKRLGLKPHFKPKPKAEAKYSLGLFRSYLQNSYLGSLVKSGRSACTDQTSVRAPWGTQVNLGSVFAPPVVGGLLGGARGRNQKGGHLIQTQMAFAVPTQNDEDIPVLGAALVKDLYNQAISELKARGGSIDSDFHDKIRTSKKWQRLKQRHSKISHTLINSTDSMDMLEIKLVTRH